MTSSRCKDKAEIQEFLHLGVEGNSKSVKSEMLIVELIKNDQSDGTTLIPLVASEL